MKIKSNIVIIFKNLNYYTISINNNKKNLIKNLILYEN